MGKAFRQSLLTIAGVTMLAPAAIAADLYQAPVPQQYEEAVANSGWYLRADAGYSWLDWNGGANGDAVIAGGGFGYQFNNYFRSDVRLDYGFGYGVGGGVEADVGTVMANGYIDLPMGSAITPYLGAGIGYGWADFTPGGSDGGLAWSATAGVAYQVTNNIAFDVGYRYRSVDIAGPDIADHSVMAGLRWMF